MHFVHFLCFTSSIAESAKMVVFIAASPYMFLYFSFFDAFPLLQISPSPLYLYLFFMQLKSLIFFSLKVINIVCFIGWYSFNVVSLSFFCFCSFFQRVLAVRDAGESYLILSVKRILTVMILTMIVARYFFYLSIV